MLNKDIWHQTQWKTAKNTTQQNKNYKWIEDTASVLKSSSKHIWEFIKDTDSLAQSKMSEVEFLGMAWGTVFMINMSEEFHH